MIWPRGFPLDEIRPPKKARVDETDAVPIGVWQGLANCDPDVDALYRLIIGRPVTFDKKPPVFLDAGRYCPFNSQNTFWRRETFPFLYLPASVSFRFTDILRGYVAQRLMWNEGLRLGFTGATVYQQRNQHNLMRDFRDEVECYLNTKHVIDKLESTRQQADPLENLLAVYSALIAEGLIDEEERKICEAWAKDLRNVN